MMHSYIIVPKNRALWGAGFTKRIASSTFSIFLFLFMLLRYMFGGKAQIPMVVRTMIGAGFRAAGQHSGCHYSVFTHMPGLKTVIPCTPYDAKGLLISAIRDPDPVIFFERKLLYGIGAEVPEGDYTIPLGVVDIKRKGKHATPVAMGRMVHIALEVAEKLLKGWD